MKKLFLILGFSGLLACTNVPITGRKQLILLPEGQMLEMGVTSYQQFLTENKSKVEATGKDVELVKKVGQRIAAAVELYLNENNMADKAKSFKWEFNVIDENVANAWCMPGGKVVVYTGILPITKDEAGLAVVMGHEIAHAVANHGNERMSQGMLQELGFSVLDAAMSEKPEQTKNIFLSAYGLSSQMFGVLPFSRLHESEADKLGLIFMAMAGYQPSESVGFWERMAKVGGESPPEFMSTHPSNETRISKIKEYLPEAEKYFKAQP